MWKKCYIILIGIFWTISVSGYNHPGIFGYITNSTPDFEQLINLKPVDEFKKICYSAEDVSVRIVTYHYIREPDRDPAGSIIAGNSISPSLFENHMQALSTSIEKNDAAVLFFSELEELINSNCFPNKNIIILSADDGRWDNYGLMFPVLKKYQIKINLGIIYNNVAQGDERIDPFMTVHEINEMVSSGLAQIQSHTLSHPDLTKLTYWKQKMELCASKLYLEKLFNTSINTIIYPLGKANDTTRGLAKQCGYTYGVSTKYGITTPQSILADQYSIKRIRVTKESTSKELFGN